MEDEIRKAHDAVSVEVLAAIDVYVQSPTATAQEVAGIAARSIVWLMLRRFRPELVSAFQLLDGPGGQSVRLVAAWDPAVGESETVTTERWLAPAWGVGDVLCIRPGWTEERAAEELDNIWNRFNDRITELGWDVLGDLLPGDGDEDDEDEETDDAPTE